MLFDILLALGWIVGTLLIASIGAIVAKRHGVEYIIALIAALIIIANILAAKVINFLWWAVPAGFIVYSATFLMTDMLSEFFGKKEAKRAVWCGFLAQVIFVLSVLVAMYWKPAPFWENQEAFSSVLGLSARIAVASMVAYLISQFNDVFLYHKLKKATEGKHLWLRNNLSTAVSQLLDTVIFITIAFYGLFPILPMIIGQYIVKLIVAVIDTPFLYSVKFFYRRKTWLRLKDR